ncbi:MAG: tRNA pseudouridine(38-40) synthase TruA [Dehalococcoidia bacterium]|jgi:tRNA pseudouridine38-40 synthase|nr:tRNA pseudouridine(38-40) synthase TruA [Dehalococcoidia bacterium]MDP7469324.1 tRNA pseudouridine(38-40) synthase TruA [Dehalococcoidia bacterium]
MNKVALVVEYDGGGYHGFQYQANAHTVQAEIEATLKRFTDEDIRVQAASRTDTGVHAREQIVSFRSRVLFPPSVWLRALNHYLPDAVAVRQAYLVGRDLDVRRQATSRAYRYSIFNSRAPSPLKRRFSYFFPSLLDVEAMDLACLELVGEHDFSSFTPVQVGRAVRTVYRAAVEKKGEMVTFDIEASSFLPHQVRHTAGSLLQVGRGRLGVNQFHDLVNTGKRGMAGPALPPNGLCLMKVNYAVPLGDHYENI